MPGKVQPIVEYNTRTRTTRTLKPKEVRAVIMEGYGLKTQREYEKFYDIMRNKLRAYQAMHGGVPESPRTFLYTTAKSRIKYGAAYQPSERTQRIMATPSISSGRIAQYMQSGGARKAALDQIKKDFQGFIDSLPPNYKAMTTRLYNRILKDPSIEIKSYQMFLDALAKEYKARREENGEVIPGGSLSGAGATYESFGAGQVSTINYLVFV